MNIAVTRGKVAFPVASFLYWNVKYVYKSTKSHEEFVSASTAHTESAIAVGQLARVIAVVIF